MSSLTAGGVRRRSADQWRHSVAAPGVRLARQWHYMEVCWVTIAQAHLSNLKGMLEYPTSRFPPLQRSSSDSTTFDPLRASSFSPFLSLSLSIIPYTLSPSRSIAFCVVSILVRLFPIFPSSSSTSYFFFPLLLSWKIFSSPILWILRVISLSISYSFLRAVSLADFCCYFVPLGPILPYDEIPLCFHSTLQFLSYKYC